LARFAQMKCFRNARAAIAAGLALQFAAFCACDDRGAALPEHVTFSEHIAPIVFEHCSGCHRPGGSAPIRLLDYDDAERHALEISQLVRSGVMPPWLPEAGEFGFVGERRLSDRQIEFVRLWVKQGAIEGDPAQLPEPPRWSDGWQLGEPDLVVEVAESYTLPAEGFDVFRNFVIPAPVDGTHWVKAVELRPGNPRVVHHAILQLDRSPASRTLAAQDPEPGFGGIEMGGSEPPDGHLLVWTPGKVPTPVMEDAAWRLDRASDLVLQLHMLPTGKPETIRPVVGLYFTEQPSRVRPYVILLDSRPIDIPAGESEYVVTDEIELPVAVELLGLYPHAHYLGKKMRVTATLPDGTTHELLRIDDWDFHWQDEYRYERPVPLPAGTRVTMGYTYDNSAENERNPSSPPVRVVSGDRSIDEMGTLSLQVLPRTEQERTLFEAPGPS